MFYNLAIPDPRLAKPATAATPPPVEPRPGKPVSGHATAALMAELRGKIARIEKVHAGGVVHRSVALDIAAIDAALPGGGIRFGALHEAASAGPDTEHATAATLFAAGILARLDGPVLWVLRQADLFAPGLAAAGLRPDRVLFAEAGKHVLPVMEEGLRHRGLAAVVAEVTGRLGLVASRRLQLAAEQAGVMAVLIRRSRAFDDVALNEPTAAVTRWRVAALPSPAVLPHAPDTPGLGRARWRLDLTRCRGGEPGSWIVEACDAKGRLGLVADTADRSAQAA